MKLERAIGVVVGVVAFGLAHWMETSTSLRATLSPNPLVRPWFTNASGTVLFTAALVAVAAVVHAISAVGRRAALGRGTTVGAGALVAMFALMLQMGIGTLGPIVFIVGGVVLLAAGAAGGGAAAAMKK